MSSFTVICHIRWNTLFSVQINVSIGLLWLFEAIWIFIKNEIFLKNWENEDNLSLLLNGPNCMRNGIIIPTLLEMAFFKVTHQMVYLPFNKVWTGIFQSEASTNFSIFLNWNMLKVPDLCFRYFNAIWIYIKNQN